MKKLKNSWHTELAIGILSNDEATLENKLDLLTSIPIGSTGLETLSICEKYRDDLVNSPEEKKGKDGLLQGHAGAKALQDCTEEIRSNDNIREDAQGLA